MKNYGDDIVRKAEFLRGYFFEKELPKSVRTALDGLCDEAETIIADINQMMQANDALAVERAPNKPQASTTDTELTDEELDELKKSLRANFQLSHHTLFGKADFDLSENTIFQISGAFTREELTTAGFDMSKGFNALPVIDPDFNPPILNLDTYSKCADVLAKVDDESNERTSITDIIRSSIGDDGKPSIRSEQMPVKMHHKSNPDNVWLPWQDELLTKMKLSQKNEDTIASNIAKALGKTVTQVHNRWYKIGKKYRKDYVKDCRAQIAVTTDPKRVMIVPRTVAAKPAEAREAQPKGKA